MATLFAPSVRAYCALLTAFLLLPGFAAGHVVLDSPNGDEVFLAGTTITVEWHPSILHNTQDWDLWFSEEGPGGEWTPIIADLPYDSTTEEDDPQFFQWLLPAMHTPEAWVRVRQDNGGEDYEDVSDDPFSILLPGDFSGDGKVDQIDRALWEEGFGTSALADFADGDADLDGDVDGADLLSWQQWSTGAPAVTAQTVPEPDILGLALVAAVVAYLLRL